ncbi:MAG TPA: universal stress protein [Chitinophagaceae bacterium]
MPNKLYNILVPINFTGKNKWAIAKAIEIANSFDCNIHFVSIVHHHIVPILPVEASIFTPYESHADRLNNYDRLKDLASRYSNELCCNGKIEVSVLEGNPEKRLTEYIRDFEMDMVIIGLSKFNLAQRIASSIPISSLARKTNVPVLAVGPSGLIRHFKKIILPLHDDVSMRRIKMATMLARTFKSTIYMITLRRENNAAEKIINDALQMVQSISTIPVQGIILEGKNLAKTTLDYSKKINADLIMINPLREFNLPGWWNRFTNKLLTYGSQIPVITMNKQ